MATYADQAAIMTNGAFISRISIAIAKYAEYIIGNAANQTRDQIAWATRAAQSPGSIASQIVSLCVWDTAVTSLANGTQDATGLTDAQVQSIVESVVNNYALKWF